MTCNTIYYSDGTGDANHATITNYDTYDHLGIADAIGGNCPYGHTDFFNIGNFQAEIYPAGVLGP